MPDVTEYQPLKQYPLRILRQVYFVDDPYDPEWKVVIHKDPRSRRVTSLEVETTLTAPGRAVVTAEIRRPELPNEDTLPAQPAPVLEADVEHVIAHEESDDEAAYEDVDHEEDDVPEYEPDIAMEPREQPVPNVLDDL